MGYQLYVGNLSSRVTEYDLQKFFHKFGRLQAIRLKNGFGFVQFEDLCNIDDVIIELNGAELCGNRVTVEIPKCELKSPPQSFRANDYIQSRETPYRLAVENLSTLCSWKDLKEMMRNVGSVAFVQAHTMERNKGVVFFQCHDDLKCAISKYQGIKVKGLYIKLIDQTSPAQLTEDRRLRLRMQSSHTTTTISQPSDSKVIDLSSDSLMEKATLEFERYFEKNESFASTTKCNENDSNRDLELENWEPTKIEQTTATSQQLGHVELTYLDIICFGVLFAIFLIYVLFIFN